MKDKTVSARLENISYKLGVEPTFCGNVATGLGRLIDRVEDMEATLFGSDRGTSKLLQLLALLATLSVSSGANTSAPENKTITVQFEATGDVTNCFVKF